MRIPLALVLVAGYTAVMQAQHDGVPPARVAAIQPLLAAQPHGFGPPCSDRAAWNALASKLSSQIAEAESVAATPMPAWSDDDYLDFQRTGQRPRGEHMLHARQERLTPLVLAECAQHTGRFLPAIVETLEALSAQPTWTLPAHDLDLSSLHRQHYRVELNGSALAFAIAESLYLLGDELPAATRKHTQDALEARIFAPARALYLGQQKDFWLRGHSNWNAVCLGGVTGAALAVLPSREDRAFFAAAAEHFSANYLLSFTPDGYSEEGIGYWSYGFTSYALLRETLWHATTGRLDLYRTANVEPIALFGQRFQMLPGVMADFGDARFGLKPNEPLIAYINRTYGLPHSEADRNLKAPAFGIPLAGALYALFPNASSLPPGDTAAPGQTSLRDFFADAGVLVSRPSPTGHLAITIKGGGNGGHSHNDVGSFSVGLGTEQPLGDPGGPTAYTASTFTEKRFESRLLNAYGHPVPVIDGALQRDATQAHPKVLRTDLTAAHDVFVLDLTSSYTSPHLKQFIRTMEHTRTPDEAITIEDHFKITAPITIEESLPTHGAITRLDDHTFLFTSGASQLKVTLSAPGAIRAHEERIDEYGNPFTRLGLSFEIQGDTTVGLTLTPVTPK